MTERWLPVVGFEGYYEVSDQGRVRSLDRVVVEKSGVSRGLKGRVLRPKSLSPTGRVWVSLSKGSGAVEKYIARLVAEAFIPNLDNLPCVLHWDDNPRNNLVENLRWGTKHENMQDRLRNGIHHYAKRTRCSRGHEYTEENTICRRDRPGARECRECKRRYGLDRKNRRKGDK